MGMELQLGDTKFWRWMAVMAAGPSAMSADWNATAIHLKMVKVINLLYV